MLADDFTQHPGLIADDFRGVRWRATLQEIISCLTGKSSALPCYEEVRRQLQGQESSERVLQYIPLDAVVGSVARCREFIRGFLPRKCIRPERWIGVKMAMTSLQGVPPIEVYQVGESYFVQDGNHRVSVARQMGLTHMEAYVTPVTIKVDQL